MRNTLLVVFFILTVMPCAYAQNIVPNYSFEQYDFCPSGFNTSGSKYSYGCTGWGQATSGTVDYYNACDTAATSVGSVYPIMGVPQNASGYRLAYEGTAYVGIIMYDSISPTYKEYLIESIPALEIDTAYKVTIHVSLADSSRFATDGFGVFFSTYGSPNQTFFGTIHKATHIDYTEYGVISDTANWVTLSSSFVADSAYTNMIIGGFKNASEMHIEAFNQYPKQLAPYKSYYYIDNIIVEKLSSTGINNVSINKPQLYPNPFSEHATLLFNNSNSEKSALAIFNIQGKMVQSIENITGNRVQIEREGLPGGIYYYRLYNESNIITTGRFMIQ